MRLDQLRYVAAVTRHGSLRRASEHLHISQPALSESLSKLEKELGVTLLDRRRTGTRISAAGRDLLEHIGEVLDAADRLREAAGNHRAEARVVRLGTVNAGTSTLLLPALRAFRQGSPGANVEVRTLQQHEIQRDVVDGTLDLGLVNLLDGDDLPPDLHGTDLLSGRPVAVLPRDHPLATSSAVTVDDLRGTPFVGMRQGYLMHRVAHRLFDGEPPVEWHSTDGAEMGKAMVADGLGVSLLPDYSVTDDPLEQAGLLVVRPIVDDRTVVRLTLVQRRRRRTDDEVAGLAAELGARARHAGTSGPVPA